MSVLVYKYTSKPVLETKDRQRADRHRDRHTFRHRTDKEQGHTYTIVRLEIGQPPQTTDRRHRKTLKVSNFDSIGQITPSK